VLRGEPAARGIRVPSGRHSLLIATLLSLFLVGAGQIYNRQYLKGAVFLATVFSISLLAFLAGTPQAQDAATLFGLVGTFASLSDARAIAKRLQRGEIVSSW